MIARQMPIKASNEMEWIFSPFDVSLERKMNKLLKGNYFNVCPHHFVLLE